MPSDRVHLSSAEARVEGIVGGSVGVVELVQNRIALFHTPNPSQPSSGSWYPVVGVYRLQPWIPHKVQGERGSVGGRVRGLKDLKVRSVEYQR